MQTGVQQMWMAGATNVTTVQHIRMGATNADGGAMNVMATTTGATDADGNECLKMEVHDLCLGAWHAGDSTNEVAAAGSARWGS